MSSELGRVFAHSRRSIVSDGWVECSPEQSVGNVLCGVPQATAGRPGNSQRNATEGVPYRVVPPCVAFAAQCLPNSEEVAARSISQWATTAGAWLIERLADQNEPWRLHVFCVATTDQSLAPARCRYIDQALDEYLRKKQRRLLRARNRDLPSPREAGEWLIQLGLRTANAGYLSAVSADEWTFLRRCVSRFPGGIMKVPPDRRAPSRAFAKLAEAEARLARPIRLGESCVDLGSSPGSWAYWELKRGAQVVAIDRAVLRDDLMHHKGLTFVRTDAFRYQPLQRVDWLLCDVIAFPSRTAELLLRWLAEGWCRWFCVTVKFRGQDEDDKLEPLKARLAAGGHDFYLRRLTSNKNEVMAYGRAANCDGQPLGGL